MKSIELSSGNNDNGSTHSTTVIIIGIGLNSQNTNPKKDC